jgi:hypothetical protein
LRGAPASRRRVWCEIGWGGGGRGSGSSGVPGPFLLGRVGGSEALAGVRVCRRGCYPSPGRGIHLRLLTVGCKPAWSREKHYGPTTVGSKPAHSRAINLRFRAVGPKPAYSRAINLRSAETGPYGRQKRITSGGDPPPHPCPKPENAGASETPGPQGIAPTPLMIQDARPRRSDHEVTVYYNFIRYINAKRTDGG